MKLRKFKRISEEIKFEIYIKWQSGKYYSKELMNQYKITTYQLQKIINEMKGDRNGKTKVDKL